MRRLSSPVWDWVYGDFIGLGRISRRWIYEIAPHYQETDYSQVGLGVAWGSGYVGL